VPVNSQALQLGTLFDVENVSILRGPQGTGLARNSSAGAIKTYARKPTGQYGGFFKSDFGNFDYQQYEGALEAPIYQDVLSARLAFLYTTRDGTMLNRCGGAPPRELRTPVPNAIQLAAQGKTPQDAPWSICGETVGTRFSDFGTPAFGTSEVPPFLPRHINDRNNWAARGSFLFEPTLDTSFLFSVHGTRRNEFTRLGQSYGTNGFQCLGGNYAACNTVLENGGTRINGVLGGPQGNPPGYTPREVKEDLTFLAPCYNFGFANCGFNNNNPNFSIFQRAQESVARELSRNLDDRPFEGDFNYVGRTKNDTWGGSLKGEYTLPWDLNLTTVSGYDHYQREIGIDLDFSPETLFQIFTQDDGWQFYQDVKLESETNVGGLPVRWETGGWVLPEKLDVFIANDLGDLTAFGVGSRRYTQRLLSTAGYGQFAFDFWDDFTLDGGVRYNWEQRKMNYWLSEAAGTLITPLGEEDIWDHPTGTIRLTYRFREDTHIYWKYNHGWKPGHYNATGSRLEGISVANPEKIDAFETGVRANWFDGLIGGEAQVFYYKYDNYQIFTAQQFADSSPEFVVINANDAEVYGGEIDALIRPWEGAFVNVRGSWLETQFLDFVLIQQERIAPGGVQIVINREIQNSGNPLLNSPQFKISFTAEQTIPLGKYGFLVPRYDGAWTDTTYYDAAKGRGIPNNQNVHFLPKDTIGQRPYWLHNFRVAYRTPDGRLELAGWCRNCFDKVYKNYAFDGSTFQNTTIHFVGDPRTYGGTVTVTF
jgi:outer membrane receptor protein involved in Fe transport